jgi:tellurite resistance protein
MKKLTKKTKKVKKVKTAEDPWVQGFACACAIMAKIENQCAARELMREGNFCRADFVVAEVDQYDLDAIFGKG